MGGIDEAFLLAIERGEQDSLKKFFKASNHSRFNINCRDPLGRDALIIAIDNKNLGIIKTLLETEIEIEDALLYAIEEDYVDAVEMLLDHRGRRGPQAAGNQDAFCQEQSCFFSSDMTPLMLAAQRNNLEIIKLLLDRKVSPIPNPHDPRCDCGTCSRARIDDCLKHSRSRINAYKALASPSLMALSSSDPLATAFKMSAKLEELAKMEPEYKEDYMRLRVQCQAFATKLIDYTRTSKELEILLNFDGDQESTDYAGEYDDTITEGILFDYRSSRTDFSTRLSPSNGQRTQLARLKLAIQCKQKTFCAHPNIQELLATMWYENLPGFRRNNVFKQALQVICIGLMFPIYSLAYLIAPQTQIGSYIKKPFIKFICHSASYMTFIIVLILASQRVEAFYEWSSVLSLFIGEQSSRFDQQLQQQGVYTISSDILNANNFTLWKSTIHSPPAGGYSDDSDINTLAALYKHTMGQATSGSSTARGLDSLSKIFEELPASSKKRGTLPSPIESIILIWVLSLIWAELKQIRSLGMNYYRHDMWNILDSIASGCYIGTIVLRVVSYIQSNDKSMEVAREHWHAYDPTLLSEGLFATATIFSSLKLVYIFSVNPYLGPLQISLGRMIIDILRFSWIYMLVLFAFACGMNQLLWYYADLERHQCLNVTNYNLAQYYKAKHNLDETPASIPGQSDTQGSTVSSSSISSNSSSLTQGPSQIMTNTTFGGLNNVTTPNTTTPLPEVREGSHYFSNMSAENLMETAFSASLEDDSSMPPVTIDDSCKTWRHFSNVFESSQTLFWANFGLVDLENFDLTGIRQYTRFWALLMFGCYCFINVIVVLNLLIAMMNHSYVKISKRSDIEWKFARTRLWVSYFDNGSTAPAPFNIIPSTKSVRYILAPLFRSVKRCFKKFISCCKSKTAPTTELLELPTKCKSHSVVDTNNTNSKETNLNQYETVIKALVRRYLVGEQRKLEKRSGLTEEKLNRWSKLNVFT